MSTKKLYEFTMTSQNARRIERIHNDRETLRWMGSSQFEQRQLFMVDGEPEIILELAANREIENVQHVGTIDYTNQTCHTIDEISEIDSNDVVEPIDTLEFNGVNIHIFVDGAFEFTTNQFIKKSEALKHFRSMDCYKHNKVTALISSYYNDKKAIKV